MRTRRLLGAAALSTALVAGLAGCVKMDMQLDLQSDDTVDGSILMAVSSALAEMSGQDPESLLGEMNADDMVDQGAVTSTEPYDDGEYIGQTIHFEGESLESFSGGGDEDLQIVREGDEYVVSGVMDLSDAAMGTEGEGGEMFAGLMESFDVRVSITFPGAVSEHNGELDGNTVTWTPRVGETNEISARGSAIEGGEPMTGYRATIISESGGIIAGAVAPTSHWEEFRPIALRVLQSIRLERARAG